MKDREQGSRLLDALAPEFLDVVARRVAYEQKVFASFFKKKRCPCLAALTPALSQRERGKKGVAVVEKCCYK